MVQAMRITMNIVCGYSLEANPIRKRMGALVSSLPCSIKRINIFCPFLKVKTRLSNTKKARHFFTGGFVKTSNLFLRFFQELLLSYKIVKKSYQIPSEIVLISIPSMFCLFFIQKTQKTTVLDIRDLTWEYFSKGVIKQALKQFFSIIAKKKFLLCDFIICTNRTEKQLLLQKYNVSAQQIYILPNGITEREFSKIKKLKRWTKLQMPTLSYIGNIGLAQNLKTLIEAARYLRHVKIYIVGSGLEFNSLVKMCKDQSLGHVEFLGECKTETILKVYKNTNILYGQILQEYFSAIPSKVYEYLATGRYVIFGAEGATKNTLKKFNHNQVIQPDNPKLLVKKVYEIIKRKKHLTISLKNKKIIHANFIREKNSREVLSKIIKKTKRNLFLPS